MASRVVSEPDPGSPGAYERARRARVLVADDDDSLRRLIRLSVEIGDVIVEEAANGVAALAMARAHPPDVALLDWMMPGLSGLEVCRALRADPGLAGALIVIVTARVLPDDRDEALAAGADHFVAKPFSPVALLELVRDAL